MPGIEFFQTVMGRKFYEYDVPQLVDGIKRMAAALEKQKEEAYTWILADDKMPAKEGMYFVYAESQDPDQYLNTIAWYDPKTKEWTLIPESWAEAITHWMSTPKAPFKLPD